MRSFNLRIFLAIGSLLLTGLAEAQPLLKAGDPFPEMVIRPILNAPVKKWDVNAENRKLLILNFWGTWCSPCLSEMDNLAKLQQANKDRLQMLCISDEPVARLANYLLKKPSSLWLASDTNSILYRLFTFAYVGQAAILSPQNKVLALVRTDSINQALIDKLLRGDTVRSSAETGNKGVESADLMAVDSSTGCQVSWGSYRPGSPSMSKSYLKTALEGRRRTYLNVCPDMIYRDIYQVSHKQVIYEIPEKSVCNWQDKSTLCCFDLLVKQEQKDSLAILMRQALERLSPVKARLEKRVIPVGILRREAGGPDWPLSAATESESSFSGRGFEGKGVVLKTFADYVSNELQLPVIDETGLTGHYDIHTENVLRSEEELLKALKRLGLTVEKGSREMDVVVIYK